MKSWLFRIGVVLSLLAGQAVAAAEVADIERLLQEGKSQEAYALALTRAGEGTGEPEFDFVLGRAAIAVGELDQAVFALDRVVIAEPQNHAARLELGRAHALQDDSASARQEFTAVKAANPPSDINDRATQSLAQLDRRTESGRTRTNAYVELKLGTDSNVNSATDDDLVDTPFGMFSLDDDSRGESDSFTQFGFGGSVDHALDNNKSIFASIDAYQRNNSDSDEFDTDRYRIRAGMSFGEASNLFRLSLRYEELELDDESFRHIVALVPEWSTALSRNDRLTLFGQIGTQRYPDQETRDVDSVLAGVAWVHRLAVYDTRITSSIYYGDDDAQEQVGEHYGREYYGLSLAAQWEPITNHTPYLKLTLQTAQHDEDQPLFGEARDEDLLQFVAGWHWQIQSAWSVNAEVSYLENNANIDLFEYDRTQVIFSTRYDFY
jgi:tetratricopeptide (TPR) repeat protein